MEMSVKQKVDEIKLSSNEFLLPLFEVIVNALNSVEDVSEKGIIKISIEILIFDRIKLINPHDTIEDSPNRESSIVITIN